MFLNKTHRPCQLSQLAQWWWWRTAWPFCCLVPVQRAGNRLLLHTIHFFYPCYVYVMHYSFAFADFWWAEAWISSALGQTRRHQKVSPKRGACWPQLPLPCLFLFMSILTLPACNKSLAAPQTAPISPNQPCLLCRPCQCMHVRQVSHWHLPIALNDAMLIAFEWVPACFRKFACDWYGA